MDLTDWVAVIHKYAQALQMCFIQILGKFI